MIHFKAAYRFFSTSIRTFAESHDGGLELRAGEFFYDPQTQSYNQGLRERLLQERNIWESYVKLNTNGDRLYQLQAGLAAVASIICHPRNSYKAQKQLQKSKASL